MGTAYSDQKTKWNQNDPSEMIKTIEQGGRVRVAYGSFTAATEQSDIHMFNLPNGARILSGELSHAALGSSTTLSVGHAAYNNAAGTAVAPGCDRSGYLPLRHGEIRCGAGRAADGRHWRHHPRFADA